MHCFLYMPEVSSLKFIIILKSKEGSCPSIFVFKVNLMELSWIFSNVSASWICLLGIIVKMSSAYICHVFELVREINLPLWGKLILTKIIPSVQKHDI